MVGGENPAGSGGRVTTDTGATSLTGRAADWGRAGGTPSLDSTATSAERAAAPPTTTLGGSAATCDSRVGCCERARSLAVFADFFFGRAGTSKGWSHDSSASSSRRSRSSASSFPLWCRSSGFFSRSRMQMSSRRPGMRGLMVEGLGGVRSRIAKSRLWERMPESRLASYGSVLSKGGFPERSS